MRLKRGDKSKRGGGVGRGGREREGKGVGVFFYRYDL